jgi:hypothetical protein
MTSATTRFPARRSAAALATSAAIVALACAAGCSSGQQAATRPSASATVPPAVSCEATVLHLLAQSAQAAQDGYSGGLDPNMVMNRYGEQSAAFQAWIQLDGQVLAAQAEHGPDGLLLPFVPQVYRLCKQYVGQPQQGSPAS